jgi:hypothetical protein
MTLLYETNHYGVYLLSEADRPDTSEIHNSIDCILHNFVVISKQYLTVEFLAASYPNAKQACDSLSEMWMQMDNEEAARVSYVN